MVMIVMTIIIKLALIRRFLFLGVLPELPLQFCEISILIILERKTGA